MFGRRQGKPTKKKHGFNILAKPVKSWGVKGKTLKKSKEFPDKQKGKEIPQSKEKQIREFM